MRTLQILLKCKSDHTTFPFKPPQCHFIVWDYLAFELPLHCPSMHSPLPPVSPGFSHERLPAQEASPWSHCVHTAPFRWWFFTHLSPEDFIYADLPLHSGSEYPDCFLHSNCLSFQNLFINSCLCLFPYLFPQRLEETASVLLSAVKQVSSCARHQVSTIDFA